MPGPLRSPSSGHRRDGSGGNWRTKNGLLNAVPRPAPAVINAFAVMGIFVAIFSVAAFDLFSDRDPGNFGTFSRSLFSMFQVRRCQSAHSAVCAPSPAHVVRHRLWRRGPGIGARMLRRSKLRGRMRRHATTLIPLPLPLCPALRARCLSSDSVPSISPSLGQRTSPQRHAAREIMPIPVVLLSPPPWPVERRLMKHYKPFHPRLLIRLGLRPSHAPRAAGLHRRRLGVVDRAVRQSAGESGSCMFLFPLPLPPPHPFHSPASSSIQARPP
jgi:hypothetical protein